MSFESRMRLIRRTCRNPSSLVGKTLKTFATATAWRVFMYHPFNRWWSDDVQVERVYSVSAPCMFIYFAKRRMTANMAAQRTIESISVSQYLQLLFPMVLATARWVTNVRDYLDLRLVREEGGDLSRTVIAPLSRMVVKECSQDVLGLRDMVAYSQHVARNIFVLRTILKLTGTRLSQTLTFFRRVDTWNLNVKQGGSTVFQRWRTMGELFQRLSQFTWLIITVRRLPTAKRMSMRIFVRRRWNKRGLSVTNLHAKWRQSGTTRFRWCLVRRFHDIVRIGRRRFVRLLTS